jgi:hypothetical protein
MRASSFVHLSRRASVLMLLLSVAMLTYAQITPSDDAYVNSALPTTNYGTAVTLNLSSAADSAFIRFDLTPVPASYTGTSIAKATLKLYVNTVTTAGSFNVDYVTGTWAEKTVKYSTEPAIGTTIVASVPLTTASKGKYVEIDVTPAMVEWLNGTQPNDGIALVANSPLVATFDSKENTAASHPPEIDIVFAGGSGGITGITTASGSGLMGGGTSGTLNLSLLTSCSSGQVLAWNGSTWACASLKGGGTVTSVGSGTGLTGGPITTSGTLSIDTKKVPLLAAANTFTGNQTVNGNVGVTGVISGAAYLIGTDLFAFGSKNTNAFLGYAGNTTMTGTENVGTGLNALAYNTTGFANTAIGFTALVNNTTGNLNTALGNASLLHNTTGIQNTAVGVNALALNGTGVDNTAIGVGALIYNTAGGSSVAVGFEALAENASGNGNTSVGSYALEWTTTGSYNTGLGFNAGFPIDKSSMTADNNTFVGAYAQPSTGTLANASGIGAYAAVSASNTMVLGSINGVNGATSNVKVGIGTTAPVSSLHVLTAGTTPIGVVYPLDAIGGECSSSGCTGVNGISTGPVSAGVFAEATGNNSAALVAFATGNATTAGKFTGNVNITGTLTKGSGSFKIDHPLDPANKYLYHSFVESPDMMDIYNGNVVTDKRGLASVELPDWFEALNRDFRYQLTVIGQFAQAIVVKEVSNHQFTIKTNKPSVKVSWQVTGIRQDAYANAHRIPLEEVKPPQEQGHYLHPELFGAGPEKSVNARPPQPSAGTLAHTAALSTAGGTTQQQ